MNTLVLVIPFTAPLRLTVHFPLECTDTRSKYWKDSSSWVLRVRDDGSVQVEFHEIPAVPSGNQLTSSLLSKQIRAAVHENFGDHGLGSVQSNLSIKYFSPRTSTGILRVARQHYRIAWAALTLIHELLGQKVVIRVVRTAGTIKRAEMAAIERNASDIRLLSIHDEVEEI